MKAQAYSYIRFSTAEQNKGDSLRRQLEGFNAWCARNGVQPAPDFEYQDLGVSAFKGKNATEGNLSRLLARVKAGQIPKGSFLVVESLDRLSRNAILDALELFMGIIRRGVKLVTLQDGCVYDIAAIQGGNVAPLIISLTVMARAHEESKMKGQRIAASWEARRRNIGSKPTTGKCVGWCRLSADKTKFELRPSAAATVRRIFDMAQQGHGANGITKALNRGKVPTIGRSQYWQCSYIKKLLETRAVIGEYTPGKMVDGKRTLLEPVENYYPPVISRQQFATVQQMRKGRPTGKGRTSSNVFTKLAFDQTTGSAMHYVSKGSGCDYLVSRDAVVGKAKWAAWRYDEFLASFLALTEAASLAKVLPEDNKTGALDLARLELTDVETKAGRLAEFLAGGNTSSAVTNKLTALETERQKLKDRITTLETEAQAAPTRIDQVNWQDADALRLNLRATVKRITMDAKARWFKAEFLDGRCYEYQEDGDNVTIRKTE